MTFGSAKAEAMTFGSLFSGCGAMDLGFCRAGFDLQWQVEIDDDCRQVLNRHWPFIPKHRDVRAVGAGTVEPVDLICGGPPCQGISSAGKRRGFDDPRTGLWSEMLRIVRELAPRWVVVENVGSGRTRFLKRILWDLASVGFDAEWEVLSARAFTAPHRRDRVFVVAWPNGTTPAHALGQQLRQQPGRSGGSGRQGPPLPPVDGPQRSVAHPNGLGGEAQARLPTGQQGQGVADPDRSGGSGILSGPRAAEELELARELCSGVGGAWMAESGLGGTPDGPTSRVDAWERGIPRTTKHRGDRHEHEARLRMLGNSCVPQKTELIGRLILNNTPSPPEPTMTEEQLTLARRLVACEQWRWLPGMAYINKHGKKCRANDPWSFRHGKPQSDWPSLAVCPDLSDYATAAILLRMAFEAHPHTGVDYDSDEGGWWLSINEVNRDGIPLHPPLFETESECLGTTAAKALLAIWTEDQAT